MDFTPHIINKKRTKDPYLGAIEWFSPQVSEIYQQAVLQNIQEPRIQMFWRLKFQHLVRTVQRHAEKLTDQCVFENNNLPVAILLLDEYRKRSIHQGYTYNQLKRRILFLQQIWDDGMHNGFIQEPFTFYLDYYNDILPTSEWLSIKNYGSITMPLRKYYVLRFFVQKQKKYTPKQQKVISNFLRNVPLPNRKSVVDVCDEDYTFVKQTICKFTGDFFVTAYMHPVRFATALRVGTASVRYKTKYKAKIKQALDALKNAYKHPTPLSLDEFKRIYEVKGNRNTQKTEAPILVDNSDSVAKYTGRKHSPAQSGHD